MNWFVNFKVGTKLLSGFVLVAMIAGFVGYKGIMSLQDADTSDTILYERNTLPLGYIAEVGVAFQRLRLNALTILYARSAAEREDMLKRIAERRTEIVARVAAFEKTIASDDVRKAFDEFGASRKEFIPHLDTFVQLAQAGRVDQALALWNGPMDITRAREQKAIESLSSLMITRAKNRADQNTVDASAATTTMLIVVAIGVLIAIGLGVFISRMITRPLKRGVEMMQEIGKGHLGARLKIETKDEVGVLARAMDDFADDLQKNVIGTMQKIAAGDLSTDVTPKDDKDEISPALKQMTGALRGLVAEAAMLSKAAVEGKLATRGDAEKFQGGYREIVPGVNETLDAVIGPLNVAAEYVDRISKGDIPAKITDNYNGDFNEIKNNLNQCIDAVNALVADANDAVEGGGGREAGHPCRCDEAPG